MEMEKRKPIRVPVSENICLLTTPDTTKEDLENACMILRAHLAALEVQEFYHNFWFTMKREYQKTRKRKRLN